MSVVIAAIAVFPVLTLLIIGLAKAENAHAPKYAGRAPGPGNLRPGSGLDGQLIRRRVQARAAGRLPTSTACT